MNYQVAKLSDCDEIVRLLAKVFSESDPPAVAMALTAADFEQFLQVIVSVSLRINLRLYRGVRKQERSPAFCSPRISPAPQFWI
jgi:hypothetical protein